MKLSFIFFLFLIQVSSFGQSSIDSILVKLDEIIENREYFIERKQAKINDLRETYFNLRQNAGEAGLYDYLLKLSSEYQTFKFDSAFYYSAKLIEEAYHLNDYEKIVAAKTEFANILISAGMFSESMDTLKSIRLNRIGDRTKAAYYSVLSRGYFDMESFTQSEQFALIYRKKGMACYDSAMNYYPANSWEYLSLKAQKSIKLGENIVAQEILEVLINNYDLTNDQLAIQLMSMAFTHSILGNQDLALKYMIEASIADFRGAKKEAVALLFAANYLFERGYVMKASKYINVALEDSRFYGSNFRIWQVSRFLPFIKSEHIVTIEKQKQKLWNYIIIVSFLSVVVFVSMVIIFIQAQKVRKSRKLMEAINRKLTASNEELLLANKIKEEYVGYYFSVSSQIIEKLDKFKNSIGKKVRRKQYDELIGELDYININSEKQNLFNNFDMVFLKIFPGFVSKFNLLLKDDEQIHPKEGQLLNTEMRIFALIRLGIHDNEKIASILDYSVNTVYAYKSKIKNKAKVPNEEFEKEVMKIKRF